MFLRGIPASCIPDEYKLTVKSDIVAIAPLPSGLLVLTKEKPAIISGLDPSAMALSEIDSNQACVSKRSVVDMGSAVMYASPDGLVMATGKRRSQGGDRTAAHTRPMARAGAQLDCRVQLGGSLYWFLRHRICTERLHFRSPWRQGFIC